MAMDNLIEECYNSDIKGLGVLSLKALRAILNRMSIPVTEPEVSALLSSPVLKI
jgi:hypothetical protein